MDDDTSDPGQDWATMPPFECTEEPIEHATDLSAKTSYGTCTTRRSAEEGESEHNGSGNSGVKKCETARDSRLEGVRAAAAGGGARSR